MTFNPIELVYPHNMDAEFGVIGCVLASNAVMRDISFLTPEDFYSKPHGDIWQAMLKLHLDEQPISPFTVPPLMENPKGLAESGGAQQYLFASLKSALMVFDTIHAAKYLADLSQKRRFAFACVTAAENICRGGSESLDTQVIELKSIIEKITDSPGKNVFENNYEVGDQIIRDMQNNIRPFSTGLKKLDQAMDGGLYPGKSYGFAARKKVGKTALGATISCNLNQAGIKHLFIAGEMSAKEIHQRILSRVANVFPSAFRSSYGKSNDCALKIAQAVNTMPKNIIYKNAQGVTFDELKHIVDLAVHRHKIKGFILDYWQLVGGKQKGQSTAEHLDDVAQWIAETSRKNNLWSITFAQLNQDDNTRGGEGIRLAFDQLYQLHRKNLTQPEASLEMMETRYTQWLNIDGLMMHEQGPYFYEPSATPDEF